MTAKPSRWPGFYSFHDAVIRAGLPRTETVVALYIGRMHNPAEGCAWPKVETIAAETASAERTVKRAVERLEREGWIRILRASGRDKARGGSNRYVPTLPGAPEHGPSEAPAQTTKHVPSTAPAQTEHVPSTAGARAVHGQPHLSLTELDDRTTPPAPSDEDREPEPPPACDDDGGLFSLEMCERIARESAEVHHRPMTGAAARRAVGAIHRFVVDECEGYEAAATWSIVSSWACSPPWGRDLPGLGALANDPARFHEMRDHRHGEAPKGAPDHVIEIDRPGWTQAQREMREERERLAREERERRELEESDRWRPRTRDEAEEAARREAEIAETMARIRQHRAPSEPEPATWVVQREVGWLMNEWSARWDSRNPDEPWDCRAEGHFDRTRSLLCRRHGADWRKAAVRILDELFASDPRPHPDRLLERAIGTEAA